MNVPHHFLRALGAVGYQDQPQEKELPSIFSSSSSFTLPISSSSDVSISFPTSLNIHPRGKKIEITQNHISFAQCPGTEYDECVLIKSGDSIPLSLPFYYFEIEIISFGIASSASTSLTTPSMAIGLCCPEKRELNKLYFGNGSKSKVVLTEEYGKPWAENDIIGCLLDITKGSLSFTHNGVILPIAFTNVLQPQKSTIVPEYVPCIGLQYPEMAVKINFGQYGPFKFSLADYIKSESARVLESIQAADISSSAQPANAPSAAAAAGPSSSSSSSSSHLSDSMTSIVLDYLLHEGYADTAESFARSTGLPTPSASPSSLSAAEEDVDMVMTPFAHAATRKAIRIAVEGGDISTAVQLIRIHFPAFLESKTEIFFQLMCQQFVEMLRVVEADASGDERLQQLVLFGREHVAPVYEALSRNEKYQEREEESRALLKDVYSLLAYKDPSASPVSYLMDPKRRELVATLLNSAILEFCNRDPSSKLEAIVRHTRCSINQGIALGNMPTMLILHNHLSSEIVKDVG